jgi:hypothetical protein
MYTHVIIRQSSPADRCRHGSRCWKDLTLLGLLLLLLRVLFQTAAAQSAYYLHPLMLPVKHQARPHHHQQHLLLLLLLLLLLHLHLLCQLSLLPLLLLLLLLLLVLL